MTQPTHAPISVLFLVLTAACGPDSPAQRAKDGAAEVVHDVGDAVGRLVEQANAWVNASGAALRERKCAEAAGEFVLKLEVSPCQGGEAVLTLDGRQEAAQKCEGGDGLRAEEQCVLRDPSGAAYFNDGPSGPDLMTRLGAAVGGKYDVSRWLALFWQAGVNHDHCYHHNGLTYGLTKVDCDRQLLSDAQAVCANPRFQAIEWFDREVCEAQAAAAFAAVDHGGDSFWQAMNTHVDYPAWQPLWRTYGLDSDPLDEATADALANPL